MAGVREASGADRGEAAGRGSVWPALAAVLAVGLVLRLVNLASLGIRHFDEAAYLSSGEMLVGALVNGGGAAWDYWVISPPLWPMLLGVARLLLGSADCVQLLVGAAAGTAGIAVTYLLGAELLGSHRGGQWAALLLAVCPLHVQLSRSGMADALFATLVAVAALGILRAFRRGSWRAAAGAGLAVAAAGLTKYHGVIFLAGVLPLLSPRLLSGIPLGARLRRAGLTFAVAAACLLPWGIWIVFQVGLGEFAAHRGGFVELAPLNTAARYATMLWVGGGTVWLLPVIGGALLCLRRAGTSAGSENSPAKLETLTVLSVLAAPFALVLLLYTPYVRLLLVFAPLASVVGARTLTDAENWLEGTRARRAALAVPVLAVLLAGLPGLWRMRRTWYTPTNAYRASARMLGLACSRREAPVVLRADQMRMRLYLLDEPNVPKPLGRVADSEDLLSAADLPEAMYVISDPLIRGGDEAMHRLLAEKMDYNVSRVARIKNRLPYWVTSDLGAPGGAVQRRSGSFVDIYYLELKGEADG